MERRDAADERALPSSDALDASGVDETLLDWYLGLSVSERLRAASKSAATLERLRRAASTDR